MANSMTVELQRITTLLWLNWLHIYSICFKKAFVHWLCPLNPLLGSVRQMYQINNIAKWSHKIQYFTSVSGCISAVNYKLSPHMFTPNAKSDLEVSNRPCFILWKNWKRASICFLY
jgi:hypothetical protein